MALVQCRECKGEVSSQAKVCPHCGLRKPGPIRPLDAAAVKIFKMAVASVLVLLSIVWIVHQVRAWLFI